MTRAELNELVEHIIRIRDINDFTRQERKDLADVCNIIYDNIDILQNEAPDIRVGDVVCIGEHKIIVTLVGGGKVFGFNREYVVEGTDISKIKRTGRHFDGVEKLLDQLEESEE